MRDSQHDGQDDRSGSGVSVLARSVVARIAARDGAGPAALPGQRVDAGLVAALARAYVSGRAEDLAELQPDLRRARIGETELVDRYFPAVARYLGCAWADDRAAFAEVTLGVARMQARLRQYGRNWDSNTLATCDSATVLLLVPEGEQHVFGSLVLCGQLRRRGISVRLEMAATPPLVAALLDEHRFDCAMISVGCEEKLELSRRLVNALRKGPATPLRVAVGGAVLDRPVDVKARTGADVVSNDPQVALAGMAAPRLALVGGNAAC
jgi:MerR family transcriptional regulator, light-induced transcriptional regulator